VDEAYKTFCQFLGMKKAIAAGTLLLAGCGGEAPVTPIFHERAPYEVAGDRYAPQIVRGRDFVLPPENRGYGGRIIHNFYASQGFLGTLH